MPYRLLTGVIIVYVVTNYTTVTIKSQSWEIN